MTLKVVSIGAGWVTTSRHLPALKRDERVEVIGIVVSPMTTHCAARTQRGRGPR